MTNAKSADNKKITIGIEYILIILTVFILSALNDALTVLGLGIVSLLFVYMNIKTVNNKNSIFVPTMTVILLLFQNFSIGIGAHFTRNFSERLSFLTQIPTLFISISYLFIIAKKRISKTDLIYIVYVFLCFLQMFQTDASIIIKILYLRNFIGYYMGFTIGKYYLNEENKIRKFIDVFLKLSIIAAAFGLVGVVLGKNFYTHIGTMEVYAAKKYTSYKNGLPGNFRTLFAGRWVNRLVSLYYEPVNFSYFMALSVLIAWIEKRRILAVCLLVCEILTFGKGGLLILLLAGACVMGQKMLKRFNEKVVKILIFSVIIVGVVGLVVVIQKYYTDDFGTANHFYGIATGVKGIIKKPFGYGIGSAGNLLKTSQRLMSERAVAETGLINMIYQIGIVASLLFITILLYSSKYTLRNYRRTMNDQYLLFTYLPFVLLIVSIFQENTFTPQCIIPYMIYQGAFSGFINYSC